jgi:hypothetical protein
VQTAGAPSRPARPEVVVHDEPNVLLVDAKPERVCCDHDLDAIRHELLLRELPIGGGHLAVIHSNGESFTQSQINAFGFLDGGNVHDARAGRRAQDGVHRRVFDPYVDRPSDLEPQVGPCKPGHDHERVVHPELAGDVLPHLPRGGRRQGEDGRTPEARRDRSECQVVWTEVVAPVAHAVRFVDDEQVDVARQEMLEELAVLESLGRHIQDVALSRFDLLVCGARLRVGEVRVHGDGVHALSHELVVLIFHERDQRRHDDREAGQQQRRQLVDDGLATARGHDHDDVAALKDGLERWPLPGIEVRVAESLHKERTRTVTSDRGPGHNRRFGRNRAAQYRRSDRSRPIARHARSRHVRSRRLYGDR